MSDSPATSDSLLARIRNNQDQEAWNQFVHVYAPLVYRFARKQGLQDADAADLTQEVLQTVARAAERFEYDPRRGSFRGWLFSVCRTRFLNYLQREQRQTPGTGDTLTVDLLQNVPADGKSPPPEWELEYTRRLFNWAAEQVQQEVQPSTWQAFWLTAVENLDPRAVADRLNLSLAAVYLAKSRVMARMKEYIRRVEAD